MTVRLIPGDAPPVTITLEGNVDIGLDDDPKAIHYKTPFASPPHLTFPSGHFGYTVSDETAESFKVDKIGYGDGINVTLKWKAEGMPRRESKD